MSDTQPHGRTGWDFASEIIKWRILIIFLVGFIFIVVPSVVHVLAEPGTEVSLFFGLVKYQKTKKASQVAESAKAVPPSIKGYFLPTVKDFSSDPTPILDGTINLGSSTNAEDGAYFISGANIDVVAFAARTPRGDALVPKVVGGKVLFKQTDTIVELEYKGNFFVVATEMQTGDEATFVMTVSKLEMPTLKLKKFAEYSGR